MAGDALADAPHEDTRKGTFGMLFSHQYWRSTLFMSGFWFCAVAPYFAIATFADSVLKQYGFDGGLAGVVGRGIGTGSAAAISRLGAGVGTFLLPISVQDLGIGPSMLIAAGVALVGAALSQ